MERRERATGWVEKEDFLEVLDLSGALKDRLSSARWREAYGALWAGEGLCHGVWEGRVRHVWGAVSVDREPWGQCCKAQPLGRPRVLVEKPVGVLGVEEGWDRAVTPPALP